MQLKKRLIKDDVQVRFPFQTLQKKLIFFEAPPLPVQVGRCCSGNTGNQATG